MSYRDSKRSKLGLPTKAGNRSGGVYVPVRPPKCSVCGGPQVPVKVGPIFADTPSTWGMTYKHDTDIHRVVMQRFNAEAAAAFAEWTTSKLKLAASWKKALNGV